MYEERNRERYEYNAAKTDTLNAVAVLGSVTAQDIARFTYRTEKAASMSLLRYHRHGLLSRRTLTGRIKVYELTDRGRSRLEWLNSTE